MPPDLRSPAGVELASDPVLASIQIAGLRARVAQDPGSPGPRNRLAALLSADGRANEAESVLRDTIDSFPRNAKARDQLKALLERPFNRQAPEPAQAFPDLMPVPAIPLAIEALLAESPPHQNATGWSVTQEPRDVPIRLSSWFPRAEWIAAASIVLVVGAVWQVRRLLPEGHLLQQPAEIVVQATIAAASGIAVASLHDLAPLSLEMEPPASAPLHPVMVAAAPAATLSPAMPQLVVILQSRPGAASDQAAHRVAARLGVLHLAVSVPRTMPAGPAGIGYFYAEDRPQAEALSHSVSQLVGSQRGEAGVATRVRLISGPARIAQQPGAIAIVMP